jgi:hypothetical protein
MRRQENNYNVSVGEVELNYIFLANIFSFVIQNLTQHIHCTSWYFKNHSRL